MILTVARFVREHNLTADDITEVIRAEPTSAQATMRRCDRWDDGWISAIYGRHQVQLAIAIGYPSPIEAFRAACARLPEVVRWRGTDVEVVA